MIRTIPHYLSELGIVIRLALRADSSLLHRVTDYPESVWLVITVALLAGISLLAGQSAVLFVNRLTPGRFVFSLGLNGMIFVGTEMVEAVSIWLIATYIFGFQQQLSTTIRIILLSTAPLVFGFLVMVPYFGLTIDWILRVWSVLITLTLVEHTFEIKFWQAMICTLLAWLLLEVLKRIFGRPISAFRDFIWRTVTGTPFEHSVEQQVEVAIGELSEKLQTLSVQV